MTPYPQIYIWLQSDELHSEVSSDALSVVIGKQTLLNYGNGVTELTVAYSNDTAEFYIVS